MEARKTVPLPQLENRGQETLPIHHIPVVTLESPRRSASNRPSVQSLICIAWGTAFHRAGGKIPLVFPRKGVRNVLF